MAETGACLPLSGFTVVEMGNFIAAPTAGKILAEFGADVIKIERPCTGDELRGWRQHGDETSLVFRLLGRNKRSITLDLRTQRGQQIALSLCDQADVLLENFRPGTLERWELGPERLHQTNPDLIITRVSGYGQTGPYRDRPGFGGVAEAIGGLRNLTGYPGMPPVRVGVSLADSTAGLYAVIGTLMSLLHRRAPGGAGEVVDVALYEAVHTLTESLLPEFDAFGVERGPTGTTIPGVAPSNSYLCQDGTYVVIGGNNDALYRRLMMLIGRSDLAEDPDLQDNRGRVARADEIDDAIRKWTSTLPETDVLAGLHEAGIPAGSILTAADIAADNHYAARGMHEEHSVPLGEHYSREVAFPGIVPKLSRHPGRTRWLGPELGEHTDHVLDTLGVGAAERDLLRAEGVI